jgi:chromate transporter
LFYRSLPCVAFQENVPEPARLGSDRLLEVFMRELQTERRPLDRRTGTPKTAADERAPRLREIFFAFLRLGAVSFGGPAMVSYIGKLAVAQKRWISEDDFRQGVALCQAVPGATAMQCAAYVGLRARKLGGAAAAYVGFGLPAFLLMLALSIAYRRAADVHAVTSALVGLRVIVVALIANAAWTFGRSSVRSVREGAIAAVAAAAFFFGGNPFLIVVGSGLAGAVALRGEKPKSPPDSVPRPGWRVFRAPGIVLALAVALITTLLLFDRLLAVLGLTMMKVDVFAFGGGFASIPLMFREVVDARSWLPSNVFMDGIALGQITPGPIVITATFVGYQAMGIAGALVGTVCIFLPSLFLVVLVEPWFRRLRSSPAFQGVTRALLLSFVGLLASVTAHFAMAAPWSVPSGAIAGLAMAALLLKVDVLWVVLAGAAISAAIL